MVIELFFDIWSRFRLRPILTSVIWAIFVFSKLFLPTILNLFDRSFHFLGFLTYLVIFVHSRQNIPFDSNFCSKPRCLFKNMATPVFQFCTFVLYWFDSSCQTISYFVSYNESENLKTSADPCKSCKRQLKRLKFSRS